MRKARPPIQAAALALLVACKGPSPEPVGAAPSPQARSEPAPLASPPTVGRATSGDSGPSPEALSAGQELPPDTPREAPRDPGARDPGRDPKDLTGFAMQVVLRAGEGPGPPRAPEVNLAAIEAAKHKLEARMAIEASQTRARFVLTGGLVVPQGTELRARADRYGHLLLWPGEPTYHVVEPGALRALLGERRLDVAPFTPASVVRAGDGAHRLNMHTRRVDVSTRGGRATLELATLHDSGEGGTLVCRLLLDLMNAPPSTPACATDEVPLHAELRWSTQGALVFDVTSLVPRADLQAQDLAAPPPSLQLATSRLPTPPSETGLSRSELAAFRTAPVDVPLGGAHDARPPPPEAGLAVVNGTEELRVVWIDGVPVAWVAPGERSVLPSLARGRYLVQWRTFLGDSWEPPELTAVPGTSGAGDARGP